MIGNFSAYDFLTNFVPGVVFIAFTTKFTGLQLQSENLVVDASIYFFCGVVVSRVGSLVVEPILQAIGLLKFADYTDYLDAELKDEKIQTVLEVLNFYRSLLTSLLLSVVVFFVYANSPESVHRAEVGLLLFLTSAILLAAYLKQARYMQKRVLHHTKERQVETDHS